MNMIKNAHFDWDDNILYMPTRIVLFHKKSKQELAISTRTFALVKHIIGKEDKYIRVNKEDILWQEELGGKRVNLKSFELNYDDSFREFRDKYQDKNIFMEHVKKAIKEKRFGPSWNDFVEICSHKDQARRMSIITARGQSPQCIFEGLKYLKEKNIIKYLPLRKNIYPVSYKNSGEAVVPAEAKTQIVIEKLDKLSQEFADCDEKKPRSFGFSDDDEHTFSHLKKTLEDLVKKGHWKNLELNLYYTGEDEKERHIIAKTKK